MTILNVKNDPIPEVSSQEQPLYSMCAFEVTPVRPMAIISPQELETRLSSDPTVLSKFEDSKGHPMWPKATNPTQELEGGSHKQPYLLV